MPFTARRFGVTNPFDPRQNIFGGVQYLRFLLDLFQGDTSLALAGYNAGENNVTKYHGIPPFKETQNYVQKIQGYYSQPRMMAYAPSTSMTGYAPSTRGGLFMAYTPPKPQKVVPARPRVFYKWQDDRGLIHVAEDPPDDGISYTMIRALD
jgi:hypothetical protein